MNNNFKFEKKLHVLAFVVLVLSAVMTWMGYGQDIEFHAQRLVAIAAEMKNGLGIYRIYTTVCEGYGYASPMFYGDIFMYPFAALVACGVSVGIAFRLFLASIMVAAYASMYCCVKSVKGKNVAVVAAYLYAFSPILLEDIFIRYAVGEAMAFIFIPIVLLGYYRIVIEPKDERFDWIYLALGMSGLIFSHIISTVLTAILLVVLCFCNIKWLWKDKKKVLKIVYAAILTVGITAYFTLPMLEQMINSKFYVINRQTSNLAGNVAPMIGLLFGSEYVSVINLFIEKIAGVGDYFSFSWFPGAFGYLLFFVLYLRFRRKNPLKEEKADIFLVISIIYLIICTVPFIQPILEPLVGFIKIPWRNLTFYIFFLSVCAALLLVKQKEIGPKVYKLGMLIATGSTLIAFLGLAMITIHNGMFPFESLSTTSIGLGEYLPSEVSNYDYSLERGDAVYCSEEEVVYAFERKDGYAVLSYEGVENTATFEVPMYMYLGYAVVNQETMEEYEPSISDNGLVQFTIQNSENGNVMIYYEGTLLQKVTVIISALTITGVIVICLSKMDWRKK